MARSKFTTPMLQDWANKRLPGLGVATSYAGSGNIGIRLDYQGRETEVLITQGDAFSELSDIASRVLEPAIALLTQRTNH